MKVKPAKFKLKKNYVVPEQRGGVQLPPIHMRPACDRLLDELEEAEVIEPSPPDDSEFASTQSLCRNVETYQRSAWLLIISDRVSMMPWFEHLILSQHQSNWSVTFHQECTTWLSLTLSTVSSCTLSQGMRTVATGRSEGVSQNLLHTEALIG